MNSDAHRIIYQHTVREFDCVFNMCDSIPKSRPIEALEELILRFRESAKNLDSINTNFEEARRKCVELSARVEQAKCRMLRAKLKIEETYGSQYQTLRKIANDQIGDRRLRRVVFERDGFKCVHCGATDRLSIDHIIPVKKGGGNGVENLQTLCLSCNSSKGAK